MKVAPLNSTFVGEVESVIATSRARLERVIAEGGGAPLAIKYVPTRWAKHYLAAGRPLKVSETPGFTWGTGTYVTPLAYPISSAIFGRVGVVTEYDPSAWRVYDATEPWAQRLYLDWLRLQPAYGVLALTVHSALANQYLRDSFRETFRIDCVLFPPDQRNAVYTDRGDVWMTVSDWRLPGVLETGFSSVLTNARFTVLVEEEFEPDAYDVMRATLIGPASARAPNSVLATAIEAAYRSGSDPVRIRA